MKLFAVVSGILLMVVFAHAEEGFFTAELRGYEDTPRIPGSEFIVHQRDRPQPTRVIPGEGSGDVVSPAPSDATVLFDGSSLEQFQGSNWQIHNGHLVAGQGNLLTKSAFGDCQLHVEWRAPDPPQGKPSDMGNSGILFMQLYELQIYDSYTSKIYADGAAAAIYGQTPPMVNVCRPPGQWQTYDVVFTAPEFDGDDLVKPAWITVLHNNVLVHDRTQIIGPMAHRTTRPYHRHAPKLPLMIQGHNSPVEFRNLWIRDLKRGTQARLFNPHPTDR